MITTHALRPNCPNARLHRIRQCIALLFAAGTIAASQRADASLTTTWAPGSGGSGILTFYNDGDTDEFTILTADYSSLGADYVNQNVGSVSFEGGNSWQLSSQNGYQLIFTPEGGSQNLHPGDSTSFQITYNTYDPGNMGTALGIAGTAGSGPRYDNFSAPNIVPEPTTLALMAVGALVLGKRKLRRLIRLEKPI